MPSARVYDAVVAGAEACFELDGFAFGPSTNLTSIAGQTDGECLEDLIRDLDKQFAMRTPDVVDKSGRTRVPQLLIPDVLTVTQLAEILDSSVWPDSWISPTASTAKGGARFEAPREPAAWFRFSRAVVLSFCA